MIGGSFQLGDTRFGLTCFSLPSYTCWVLKDDLSVLGNRELEA